jgi:hypothetical protein
VARILLTGLSAVPFLLAGAGLAAVAGAQAGSDGAFSTPERRFATPTAALKTDEIQVDGEMARAADPSNDLGELAEVRVVVRPADPRVPHFVGVGPKAAVEKYLRGVSHEEFVSADLQPFTPVFRRMPGAVSPAASPDGQRFWAASSAGSGTRTLTWDKTGGAWSVVVMRMDGRPGIEAHASIGLRFDFLTPAAAITLIAGAAPLTAAAVMAIRRRRVTPSS